LCTCVIKFVSLSLKLKTGKIQTQISWADLDLKKMYKYNNINKKKIKIVEIASKFHEIILK
jgi:hypothetical protein